MSDAIILGFGFGLGLLLLYLLVRFWKMILLTLVSLTVLLFGALWFGNWVHRDCSSEHSCPARTYFDSQHRKVTDPDLLKCFNTNDCDAWLKKPHGPTVVTDPDLLKCLDSWDEHSLDCDALRNKQRREGKR